MPPRADGTHRRRRRRLAERTLRPLTLWAQRRDLCRCRGTTSVAEINARVEAVDEAPPKAASGARTTFHNRRPRRTSPPPSRIETASLGAVCRRPPSRARCALGAIERFRRCRASLDKSESQLPSYFEDTLGPTTRIAPAGRAPEHAKRAGQARRQGAPPSATDGVGARVAAGGRRRRGCGRGDADLVLEFPRVHTRALLDVPPRTRPRRPRCRRSKGRGRRRRRRRRVGA